MRNLDDLRIRVGLGKAFHRIATMSDEVERSGYPRPREVVTLCGRKTGFAWYPGHTPVGDTYSNGNPLPICAVCERAAAR